LEDIHDVLCQAARSVIWINNPVRLWAELARRIDGRASTEVRRGDKDTLMETLAGWRARTPSVRYTINIVQPGLETADFGEWAESWPHGATLVASCYEWVVKTGATFRVIGG
jgi:hypothetical protein